MNHRLQRITSTQVMDGQTVRTMTTYCRGIRVKWDVYRLDVNGSGTHATYFDRHPDTIPQKRPRVAPAPVRVARLHVRTDAAATMAVASIGESDAGDGAAGGDSGDESEGGDDDPPPPCRLKSKARLTRARLPGTNFNPIIIPGLLPRQATRQVYLSFDGGRHGCKRRREGGFSGR